MKALSTASQHCWRSKEKNNSPLTYIGPTHNPNTVYNQISQYPAVLFTEKIVGKNSTFEMNCMVLKYLTDLCQQKK